MIRGADFRALFDLAADAMFILDGDLLILEMNRIAHRQLGYAKGEMLGRNIGDFVLREFVAMQKSRFAKVRNQGYLIYESAMVRKDGSVLAVEIGNRAIALEGRQAFFAVVRDISDRKRLDGALKESEDRFRTLSEDAPEAIAIHDLDSGLFVDATTSAERLFACSHDEILRHRPEHFYAPDQPADTPSIATIRERGLRILAGEQMKYERLVRNMQGQDILCEVRLVRLPSTTRNLIRASYIDITERKRAEADLRIAAIAFESQDAMMITDADGVILRVNRAFTETTGYSTAEAVGQTPRLLASGRHDAAFYDAMWSSIRRTGTWQGEVWNRRKNGEVYPAWLTVTAVQGTNGAVTHYVGTHMDISHRKEAEDKLHKLAFYDPLTKLPNRRLLLDRLGHALASSARSQQQGAIMFIDLDNFKTLNDTQGHDVGDRLLVEAAQRLQASVRQGDTVARLGGDEFVVMLEDLKADSLVAAQVEGVAEKVLAALDQPYRLELNQGAGEPNAIDHHCTASIGVTLFGAERGDVDELMKQADLAMYQAKNSGRNTIRFFDPYMQVTVTARVEREAELREAVQAGQFLLHYQPQVAGLGRMMGAEALVRWQHPQRGIVSPAEFIALAEETGLILPLGHWVLASACARLAKWATQPEMAHLTVAVNVSAHQFRQADFVDQVLAVLADTGANPQRLKLELTESLLVNNVEDVIAKMTALKSRGVGFALDDFGTGYSSLSYLKRLPLEQLKIDQSFVRDVLTDANDAAIAKMIVALAESLGLAVIAEGVEVEAQREFLASHGCHAYQGYLLSRPLPVEAFEDFVQQAAGGSFGDRLI